MKYLKLLIVSISVFVLFFLVKPASSETLPERPVYPGSISGNNYSEFVYIDGRLYEIVYSDDGKIILIQPID
ncbi:MAG: hypothetical protein JSS63_00285 [Bacteroidetes bacterium]|nr:hypothetical protein [Bacteroidota bacterium]